MIPAVLPYGILLRWGAIGVFVLLLIGAGFRCGKDWDAKADEKAAHAAMVCGFDRDALSEALNQVNAIADQAKRDAAAQAVYAVEAVRQADKDREAYERRSAALGKELAEAMEKPSCRIEMEKPLCAPLH